MQLSTQMRLRRVILHAGIAFISGLTSGCMTTTEPTSEVIHKDSGENPGVPMQQASTAPDIKIDWQQYFQARPDGEERSRLELKVTRWTDSGGAPELLAKGRTEIALGKLRAAEGSLRESLRLMPANLEAWVELAGVYARTKEPVKLFEVLGEIDDKMASKSEVSPALRLRVAFLRANGLEMAGRVDESREVLSSLIQRHGDFTPAYVALANSYLNSGKDSVAEFIAKRAVDRGKEDPAVENILGAVAFGRQDKKGAVAHFNRALELSPTYCQALVNRAIVSLSERNHANAEEDLNRALVIDPANTGAQVVRGILFRRTGRVDLAKAAFERVLELDPLNPEARFNLAVLSAVNGKNPEYAMRLFQEVISLPGVSPDLSHRAQQGLQDLKAMM